MAAKVIIEMTTQEHNLLMLFLDFAVDTLTGQDDPELDPDDGERLKGVIA